MTQIGRLRSIIEQCILDGYTEIAFEDRAIVLSRYNTRTKKWDHKTIRDEDLET